MMEDLTAMLGELLSGGELPEALQSLLSAAVPGESPPEANAAPSGIDLTALLGLLGSGTPEKSGDAPDLAPLLGLLGGKPQGNTPPGGADPALLGKLMKLLAALNRSDRNTELLRALAPFCDAHRKKRVEEAAQMMRMIKLLPLLGADAKEE